LHVATIGATIAKGLGLDENMAYAIGLAHDLGHAPFGHAGEEALKDKTREVGGFIHEVHGLRVLDVLGNRGVSLNLTYGVRDGVVCHCGERPDKTVSPREAKIDLSTIRDRNQYPCSYEGCAARMSDRLAYLGRDLEDAIYGGFVRREDVPREIEKELGETNGEIINTLVIDVIESSKKIGTIGLSDDKYEVLMKLYDFSADEIYSHPAIQRYKQYCKRIVEAIFDYLVETYSKWDMDFEAYFHSPVPLDARFGSYLSTMRSVYKREKAGGMVIVRDYIAGMTDGYALKCMREISLPEELNFDKPGR
jgi:dGTPase